MIENNGEFPVSGAYFNLNVLFLIFYTLFLFCCNYVTGREFAVKWVRDLWNEVARLDSGNNNFTSINSMQPRRALHFIYAIMNAVFDIVC